MAIARYKPENTVEKIDKANRTNHSQLALEMAIGLCDGHAWLGEKSNSP